VSLINDLRKARVSLGNFRMVPASILSGKKAALFARHCDIITYLWYTIKIFVDIHPVCVFRVFHVFRFHISYSTDRGRNHCTYDPTRMRKWSNSFISSTILSSSADLAFHKIYAFSCTLCGVF